MVRLLGTRLSSRANVEETFYEELLGEQNRDRIHIRLKVVFIQNIEILFVIGQPRHYLCHMQIAAPRRPNSAQSKIFNTHPYAF